MLFCYGHAQLATRSGNVLQQVVIVGIVFYLMLRVVVVVCIGFIWYCINARLFCWCEYYVDQRVSSMQCW